MIRLEDVHKVYRLNGREKVVARGISALFPSRRAVALLGRNGAGKSTLLRMIAGTQLPDRGRIHHTGTLSWPVGFAGSFHPEMTGAQNVRFVARVQGVDSEDLSAFVQDFAEIGVHFNLPVRTYSSGMRARLAFGVSMGIHFDTYLVDEVMATGDAGFRDKSLAVFRARLQTSGLIMITHSLPMAKQICTAGAVLEDGGLTWFDRIDEAIARHLANVRLGKDQDADEA